jgi:hypothetical protein
MKSRSKKCSEEQGISDRVTGKQIPKTGKLFVLLNRFLVKREDRLELLYGVSHLQPISQSVDKRPHPDRRVRAGRENGPYPNFQRFDVSEDDTFQFSALVGQHRRRGPRSLHHCAKIERAANVSGAMSVPTLNARPSPRRITTETEESASAF